MLPCSIFGEIPQNQRNFVIDSQIDKIENLVDEMRPIYPEQCYEIVYRLKIIENLIYK